MAYELRAVVGVADTIDLVSAQLGAPFLRLDQGLALIPWLRPLADHSTPKGVDDRLDEFLDLDSRLLTALVQHSEVSALAYLEADFWAGRGVQMAAVVDQGVVRHVFRNVSGWPDSPISQALRQIGVVAVDGLDEFDTLGLGRCRRTWDWLDESSR